MWKRLKTATRINVPLLPLKIAIFLYHGANSLHAPYLVLQGFKIGICQEEMTLIFAIIPVASFAGPPIAGYLSDKLDRGKLIMMCSIFFCAVLNTSLLFIDAHIPEEEYNLPSPMIVTLECHHHQTELLHSSFILNGSFRLNRAVDYTFTIDLPGNYCTDLRNRTEASNYSEFFDNFQLTIKRRDSNWVSLAQLSSNGTNMPQFCNHLWTFECLEKLLLQSHEKTTSRHRLLKVQSDANAHLHRPGLWLFVIGLLGAKFCMTATFTLLDSCCIYLTEFHHGSIGAQKIFGVISTIIFSFVAGALVTWMTLLRSTGQRQYDLVFYGADFLFLCLALTVSQMDGMRMCSIDKEKPSKVSNLNSFLTPDLVAFLTVTVFNGLCHFYIDTYFSVFMIELGASDFLLSLSSAVASLSGIPLLLMGDRTVSRLGYAPVISLVLLTYSLRMIGYSFISNPWLCLPLEVLKALTSQFFIIAAGRFCSENAPLGLLATLNGIQHACNFSIGGGLGNFWGGFLASQIGRASGFQLMAFISATVSLIYYTFYYCCLQKGKGDHKHGKSLAIPCRSLSLPRNGSFPYKKSEIPTERVTECVLKIYRNSPDKLA